jgi:hypothetical protein
MWVTLYGPGCDVKVMMMMMMMMMMMCDESGSVWNVSTFSCFTIISTNLPAKSKENYEKDNSGYPVS